MSDHQAAIEAAAQERSRHTHRPRWDGSGDDYCSCGAPADGIGGWRHHVEERVLAVYLAPRRVPCPTCWGRVNDIAPGARCKNPDCSDGTVPADPWLTWTSDVPKYEQAGWATRCDDGNLDYFSWILRPEVQQPRPLSGWEPVFVRLPREEG